MVKFKVEDTNFNKIYPIGSIYMSINETNPSELFGGEWEQIEDKFLLACGTNHLNGTTGGEATHKLTVNEIPSHRHESSRRDVYVANGSATGLVGYNSSSFTQTGVTSYTGGGEAHNNMPPYLAVYCWVRIS